MKNTNGLSRRNLLKGFGLGAVGISTMGFVGATLAQDDMTTITSVYTFSFGDWMGYVIRDNGFQLPANFFGANGDPEEVVAYFANIGALSAEGTVGVSLNILVLTNGTETMIVDAGTGGALVPMLDALGIGADGVTTALITHWHGDHVGGLVTNGEMTFPNASVYFPQVDWDFLENGPADAVGTSRAAVQPYVDAGKVTFINAGDMLMDSIEAIDSAGHTPGHITYLIRSGDDQIMHIGDAMANAFASTENPDWNFSFDADADMAVASRKALMTRASDENIKLLGYHFSFPGMGYVVQNGDAASYPAST